MPSCLVSRKKTGYHELPARVFIPLQSTFLFAVLSDPHDDSLNPMDRDYPLPSTEEELGEERRASAPRLGNLDPGCAALPRSGAEVDPASPAHVPWHSGQNV